MNNQSYLKRLQEKWQLNSLWQVVLVLITFACTGFTVVFIKQPILDLLKVDMESGGFWKTILYLLLVLPLYQVLLLAYGFLFGQFRFFWEKEKKIMKRIGRLFIREK
ncbi:hypothetical protein IFO69_20240 [Echinicola sp. CAU 1574]|uniref:DUF6787 domain-containing protein n=1 Tax=Echinicola arenosa TaxID=2774144 RepID=A0ABR9AQY6_9BACT|nr:DUF6787 family protein [Echinicola arenosa]MBD8491095.1 hypothetical protein [Echinicola arenosa]